MMYGCWYCGASGAGSASMATSLRGMRGNTMVRLDAGPVHLSAWMSETVGDDAGCVAT